MFAMRLTTTVVFPLPAPARISTGPSVRKTASRCFSFILQKRFSNTARRSSKKRCSKVCDMIFTKPFFYRNQILTIYPAFQSKGILKGHYSIFALKNPLPNCPTGKQHTTKNGRGTSHPFYCCLLYLLRSIMQQIYPRSKLQSSGQTALRSGLLFL